MAGFVKGRTTSVGDLLEQGASAFDAAVPILSQRLKGEMAEREVRSIAYHMKAARFPAYKDRSGFTFAASEINEALVRQLHRCEFTDAAENVVLIHCSAGYAQHAREGAVLARANRTSRSCDPHAFGVSLGVQAIEHHRKRVRFFSTVELVNTLEQEKVQGKAGKIVEALIKADLVIWPSRRIATQSPAG